MRVKLIENINLDTEYAIYIRDRYLNIRSLLMKHVDTGDVQVLAQYVQKKHILDFEYVKKYNKEHQFESIDYFKNELFYVINIEQWGVEFELPAFFFEVIDGSLPTDWLFHFYPDGINVPQIQKADYGEKYHIYAIWGPKRFVLDNEYTFNMIYGYKDYEKFE
ncbi:hypothetical protein FH022_15125 [Listeria monocytogenes]|nr:hypothetical protein [Listeria monocytogenes]